MKTSVWKGDNLLPGAWRHYYIYMDNINCYHCVLRQPAPLGETAGYRVTVV